MLASMPDSELGAILIAAAIIDQCSCRNRPCDRRHRPRLYGDSSTFAKMSEHATGNAVDILALGLADKRQIGISAVANELNPDHRLLIALRLTACGYFTTVLGPGANTAHANHYHLDLGVHGTSGNYRICE